MLKKFLFVLLVFSLCAGTAFSAGTASTTGKPSGNDSDDDYWENVQISLVTIGKDDEIYSKFGHSGIKIDEPGRPSLMYDWGRFSFGPGFLKNFAMGRLWYMCGFSRTDWILEAYKDDNRDISIIPLNLTSEQKEDIIRFVEDNVLPENRTYLYNYYYDNCATRIRDLINRETNGYFKDWASNTTSLTLREHTNNLISSSYFWWYVINFLLGPECDKKATFWQAMFLPSYLAKGVRTAFNPALTKQISENGTDSDNATLGGQSSVSGSVLAKEKASFNRIADSPDKTASGNATLGSTEEFFYTSTRKADPLRNRRNTIFSFALSLFFSFGIYLFYTRRSEHPAFFRLYKCLSAIFTFILGFFGAILLFLMLFTLHKVTIFNENIIFINPVLLAAGILTFRTEKHRKTLLIIYSVLFLLTALLVFLKIIFRNVFIQDNIAFILTALPFYALQIKSLKK